MGSLVNMLVALVIIGLILYIIWWAISQIPMPEPIATVVRVVFVLVVALIAISFLLQMLGSVGFHMPKFALAMPGSP